MATSYTCHDWKKCHQSRLTLICCRYGLIAHAWEEVDNQRNPLLLGSCRVFRKGWVTQMSILKADQSSGGWNSSPTPSKINGWNLQITHLERKYLSFHPPPGNYVPAVSLLGCTQVFVADRPQLFGEPVYFRVFLLWTRWLIPNRVLLWTSMFQLNMIEEYSWNPWLMFDTYTE